MSTTPAVAKNKMRNAVYAGIALLSLVIYMGGMIPLLMRDLRTLQLTTLFCGLLGAAPLLLMRTRFFDGLVTSGAGRDHRLAPMHSAVSRALVVVMAIAVALMAWRANTTGLPGWKGGFLLIYGWGFFCVAGWLLRPPRFMLREVR